MFYVVCTKDGNVYKGHLLYENLHITIGQCKAIQVASDVLFKGGVILKS